jgi:hypothetical protein
MAYLLMPFTAQVNSSGQAIVQVTHSLSGKQWKVYQMGLALGELVTAGIAQVAASVNGAPLAASVNMQPSAFSQLNTLGQPPYAMESFFVGPPYIYLQSGDMMTVGVVNANPGDTFTCGVYLIEEDSTKEQSLGT